MPKVNHDIDAGLLLLIQQGAPTHRSYSQREIAAACKCDHRTIAYAEQRALMKFAHALHAACPELIAEIFGATKAEEVFARLTEADGERAVRQRQYRHRKALAQEDGKIPCAVEVPMSATEALKFAE